MTRWVGHCYACGREREVETRYDHGAQALCDECAAHPHRTPAASDDDLAVERVNGRFTTRGVDLAQLRPVRFAWKPWLVYGRLNLFCGEESIGKSSLQRWMIARATRGELEGELRGRKARVLWVGADEDDWLEVVTPSLYALGADLTLVREFVPVDESAIFDVVAHISELGREVREGHFDLVVFEQLLDALPRMKNSNDPVEIRQVLRPLRRMLAACTTTGLGTLHVNKAQADQLRQRMQGSMQFGALSRSTTLVDRLPADPDRRIAILGKNNYVAGPVAMTFLIESHRFDLNGREFDVGRIADVKADDTTSLDEVLRQGRRDERPRDEHRDDVLDALGGEPRSEAALAAKLGLSRSMVHRILDDLRGENLAAASRHGWTIRDSLPLRDADSESSLQTAILNDDDERAYEQWADQLGFEEEET